MKECEREAGGNATASIIASEGFSEEMRGKKRRNLNGKKKSSKKMSNWPSHVRTSGECIEKNVR